MRYLFVHAHPDDETLSTGAVIAALAAASHTALVLTATGGERGQAIPGSLPPGADLAVVRAGERARALAALGATDAGWLGEPPNRAPGLLPRRYVDSGMIWVRPGLAGPAPGAPASGLALAPLDEVAADVAAAALAHDAAVLVSYDSSGGYGHPDHVRCHDATARAAAALGLPFHEITVALPADGGWFEAGERAPAVLAAHRCYATQFRLRGDKVTHVGGETEPVRLAAGLRVSPRRPG